MSRRLRLADYVDNYMGPDVMLDFDEEDVLVGIEIFTVVMSQRKECAGYFELTATVNNDLAYLNLPTYPKKGHCRVSRMLRLVDRIGSYKGPDLLFDFDKDGILVGIEFLIAELTPMDDDSDDIELPDPSALDFILRSRS